MHQFMNKKFIALIIAFFVGLFYIPQVRNIIINSANYVKLKINSIYNSLNNHFKTIEAQRKEIEILEKKVENLNNKLVYLESNLQDCKNLKYFKIINDKNLTFVKTISYTNLPDFSSIYINYDKKFDKPLGIMYNNLAAGIVVKNLNYFSKALLNNNPKTSYTVFIGKKKIPGVFIGKSKIIKYIPKYKKISVGDLVITSGLDGIFYEGAKVGRIVSIKNEKLYQIAKIKTFFNDLNPKYFYVIRRH